MQEAPLLISRQNRFPTQVALADTGGLLESSSLLGQEKESGNREKHYHFGKQPPVETQRTLRSLLMWWWIFLILVSVP